MSEENQASFTGWARVEVMGHQTHIGFVKTEAYGQAVMFRVDTPELPEREYVLTEPAYVSTVWTRAGATVRRIARPGCSVLVGAGSIYRIIPCTEAAALKAIDADERAVLKLVSLPESAALPPGEERDEAGDDPFEPNDNDEDEDRNDE
jgi:hypothetical protein